MTLAMSDNTTQEQHLSSNTIDLTTESLMKMFACPKVELRGLIALLKRLGIAKTVGIVPEVRRGRRRKIYRLPVKIVIELPPP